MQPMLRRIEPVVYRVGLRNLSNPPVIPAYQLPVNVVHSYPLLVVVVDVPLLVCVTGHCYRNPLLLAPV